MQFLWCCYGVPELVCVGFDMFLCLLIFTAAMVSVWSLRCCYVVAEVLYVIFSVLGWHYECVLKCCYVFARPF